MAVAFGSAGTYVPYASHTNTTLTAPTSIADGDLLLAYLFNAANPVAPTITAPAGWSALTGSPSSVSDPGGLNGKFYIFYKIASSESGSYTFTHATSNSEGIVVRYTGVNASPFSPTPTVNTGTGQTATATGFTTTVADTFVIFTEHDFGENNTDTFVPVGTTPTFTERLDGVLIYIADGTLASAGATGNKSHTVNNELGSPNPWAAYLIGLNPAGGGVAPVTLNANPGSYALTGTPAALGRQIINIGAAIDDGTGDPARVAFDKCNQNFSDLYAADTAFLTTTIAAATYQPLDADLTAIAALTGTNTIYYRSAANTWSGVTVGTGLTFTSGTLAATGGGGSQLTVPQGRLTLQSLTPVMTTAQPAKTTIYYTPYVGNLIPIYDGSTMVMTTFVELSIATTDTTKSPAAIGASKLNDWFVWNDAGIVRLGHGSDWTNDTTPSGTGIRPGLAMVNGILVNNAAISSGPAAQRGTYVGTTRSNASSQLDWSFGGLGAGGAVGFFGVANAYNREWFSTLVADSTDSWTYSTATWRASNGSNTMRVSLVDPLGTQGVNARHYSYANHSAGFAVVGVCLDNTNSFNGTTGPVGNTVVQQACGEYSGRPGLGFHFLQATEYSSGATGTFRGDNAVPTYVQTGLHVFFQA